MTQKTSITHTEIAMTPAEWRLRMAELCRDCAGAEPAEEAAMLELAHALLLAAPGGNSGLLDHLPPRAGYDRLIQVGAHDSAALSLMPELASYLISRAGDGGCLASVYLPGMDEELTSEADTPALALISALAAALASVTDLGGLVLDGDDGRPVLDDTAPSAAALRCGERGDDMTVWQRPSGSSLH
ncbi:hypothetical protein GTZ99_13350 [Novosphingobium sp. FSY-8]|uniref:Uncharacterized protein n=1 Tax=Novosphingobium ovatum TaxID=1908523 RepID=A0ABW9XG70_9SPHN|nr:hypothetical protein [Novosphingobium ovatum]NBC37535.1 hypothetical protein [Novosphingobium ovatum]